MHQVDNSVLKFLSRNDAEVHFSVLLKFNASIFSSKIRKEHLLNSEG